jgi:hypothetical protein
MKPNNLNSSSDYIDYYNSRGYTDHFKISNEGLIHIKTHQILKPEDISIVAQHRFEGISNPSDMSVLYVVEASQNIKGTALVNYNPSSATELAEFFNSVPKKNVKQNSKNF